MARSSCLSPWDLVPLAAGLALGGAMAALMPGLPDLLPTHFDGRGHANGWMTKTAYAWFAFGIPFGVWLLTLGTGLAFRGSDQDPDGRKAEALAPLRALVSTGTLVLMGGGLFLPRFGFPAFGWMLGGFLALTCLGIGLAVRRLKRLLPGPPDPAHYWGGLVYANREDPRIWVPKPLGLGWTLNFAHGLSWVIMGLLALPPLAVILLVQSR